MKIFEHSPKELLLEALSTDLYELTMAAGYFEKEMFEPASFSLFIRKYPANRGYFVAAGLKEALKYLENFHFSQDDLKYLESLELFSNKLLKYLENLYFSGEVHAMPEGTIFFPNEPVMELSAPIIEAQILETVLLNIIGFSSLIASKAARCVFAADGRPLIDFSLRRTQGIEAGLKVARSSYLAGFKSTSNVLAGKLLDIPVSGTMAHSYINAFPKEVDAFRAFSKIFPNNTVLLIDTYDTIEGAKNAVIVAKEMKETGKSLLGVRLDSGDMADLSLQVREIFDSAGFPDVKIFASSSFDEFKIDEVLKAGAKIDAFGVGTKIGVSADAPYFDIVYKMVRYGDRNVRKLSPGKLTLCGKKQVFRKKDAKGFFKKDILGTRDEKISNAEPLLEKVMDDGKIIYEIPSLINIQTHFENNFKALPDIYKALQNAPLYPVELSSELKDLQKFC
jgi:nicotinate phosphoribosyltransferase